MDKKVFISIALDKRRKKDNGKYPVKLRVFTTEPRIQKLYSTSFEFTEKEFQNIWITSKPKQEIRDIREKLKDIEKMAFDKAEDLVPFSFFEFEKKLYTSKGDRQNLIFKYKEQIERFKSLDQIGTAKMYELSLKSLLAFSKQLSGKEIESLNFREITSNWLELYEKHMTGTLNRSTTTISMYLRSLRAIFNNAIAAKDIEPEFYPFGKRKYQIPSSKSVKKALDKSQLKILFDAIPKTPEQEKARDFWFLSYLCNGINVKDIALLRYENLNGDELTFIRAKTRTTSKSNLKTITIYLNEYSKNILSKYSNTTKNPKNHIFTIVSDLDSELTKFDKIKNFTRFINQNLKILAKDNGITEEISSYWARHSFATNLIRSGGSMELVGELFGHSDKKTTQNYFAGFEDNEKRNIISKIMDFG
ncbi:MAG: site-specific integrase [Saprospiraceae bacterium]|nr:site-specific integrase [Candidatus Defluviibacterium haderslevense]